MGGWDGWVGTGEGWVGLLEGLGDAGRVGEGLGWVGGRVGLGSGRECYVSNALQIFKTRFKCFKRVANI